MSDTYEVAPDPTVNASRYAYLFTNRDASEYAAAWMDSLDGPATDDEIDDWASEGADSMAAVIYTGQALALYAAGITDDEDDEGICVDGFDHTDGADEIIKRLVTGLSYVWHRRILTDAARTMRAARAYAGLA